MSFVFETICDDFLVIFKFRPARCAPEIRGALGARHVKFFFRLECEGKQSISRNLHRNRGASQGQPVRFRFGSRILFFFKETWIVI